MIDMKKSVASFVIALLTVWMMTCCNGIDNPVEPHGDVIVDYVPVEFYVMIRNADGVDLLDSTKHETFLKDISVRYNDHTYRFPIKERSSSTRVYAPVFNGLQLREYYSYKTFSLTGDWCLVFGELEGGETGDYAIMLNVGNKSIPLSCRNVITMNPSKGYSDVRRHFFVNDEMLTDDAGVNGRYHFLYTSTGDLEYVPSEYE